MLATRALLAGSFPAPTLPAIGTPTTLTSSPHGGWSNPVYPEAVFASGATYVGYVNGSTGAVSIARHASGTTTTKALDTPSPVDDHNNPALCIRGDGRILALFCEHEGSALYTMLSTNPGDISAFGSPDDTGLTSTYGFTYPALVELDGTLYLFVRDKLNSTTGRLKMAKSTDGGATWTDEALIMAGASGKIPYWAIGTDGTYIHVMSTDRDPYGSQGSPVTLGHMKFDGTDWRKSDGTIISATKPFAPSEMTTVYTGPIFPFDFVMYDGQPAFTAVADNGDSTVTGKVLRWSGSSWTEVDVYTADYHPFDRFYGSLVINHADQREAFAAVVESGVAEIRRFVTFNNGASWAASDFATSGSSDDHASPIAVIDSDGTMPIVWLYGNYVSQSSFTLGLRGLVR